MNNNYVHWMDSEKLKAEFEYRPFQLPAHGLMQGRVITGDELVSNLLQMKVGGTALVQTTDDHWRSRMLKEVTRIGVNLWSYEDLWDSEEDPYELYHGNREGADDEVLIPFEVPLDEEGWYHRLSVAGWLVMANYYGPR